MRRSEMATRSRARTAMLVDRDNMTARVIAIPPHRDSGSSGGGGAVCGRRGPSIGRRTCSERSAPTLSAYAERSSSNSNEKIVPTKPVPTLKKANLEAGAVAGAGDACFGC